MYGVGGERWLPELIVPWLSGYENSSPVRIGNEASQQLQLDVYGEVMDAMFQALKAGMKPHIRQAEVHSQFLAKLLAANRSLSHANRVSGRPFPRSGETVFGRPRQKAPNCL
jgi:GH15 family glucan-1,4-alpha-glucosidase